MKKISIKLDIKKASSLTSYNDNIKRNLVSFLLSNYCEPKNKLYLFSRGKNLPNIFLLKLIIPAKFNNKIYDINLLIYFPINFPLVQPEIYFHKYCNVKVNQKCLNYIDEESLKINYDSFFKWENNFQSFKNLIKALYKQFNINFPIFTLKDPFDESKNINYDCVLRNQLCKEIEFKKNTNLNINQNLNSKKIILKTEGNNSPNINRINTRNSPIAKKNKNNEVMINKTKTINKINNIKINLKDINNDKKSNFINNKNNTENIGKNNNITKKALNTKSEPDIFDENISKECLTKLLILELYPKISPLNDSIKFLKNNLINIKSNIIKELNFFKSKEKQTNTIEKSINLLKKELNNDINNNSDIKNKINFSNLDSFLKINNKNYYILQAKQKTIEEYLLVIKKNLEKKNIEFESGMKLVRKLSRQIFYIKYKCFCLTNKNI